MMMPEKCCHLHGLHPLLVSVALFSSSRRVRMSAPLRSERSVITVEVTVESTDGSGTGHVVLGVLGGIALVFFLVVILVPVIRWRKRRKGSVTASRAGSRRTHARIISEYNQDVIAPLLEEQPAGMVINVDAPSATQGPKTTPSRPPTALLNWKILQTLPDFDNDSSESSLRKPVDSRNKTLQDGDDGVRFVDADRRSAALPPIPVNDSEGPSRSSTLVASLPPSSPLVNAFQRSVSLATSGSTSNTNSIGTFRYPSLASSSSKSSAPPLDSTPRSSAYASSPSWFPKSLVPGPEGSSPNDTRWRVPSMPPIAESVHSGSISSLQHAPEAKKDSPPPAARLRDSNASAGPSTIQHVREASGSGEAVTQGSLSRSSTQHTDKSNKASFVERDDRRISTLTHGTFGHQGHSRDSSYGKPSVSEEGGMISVVSPVTREERSLKRVKRRTLDYPREPSPPLDPVPLSAPPPLHSVRPSNLSRSTRPSSQPMPDPQSPEDDAPEGEATGPYGHNQEASSSSEHLLPSSDTAPLLPELPSLPQLSPLSFEFKFGSVAASRNNSTSTVSRSGKSDRSKGKGKGHVKSPSKASTVSAYSSGTGSKRSLRSPASVSSARSGSSRSHSKSRERPKHNRKVTFGDEAIPPPIPAVDAPNVAPVPEPPRKVSRPLPTLPATVIADYTASLPTSAAVQLQILPGSR